MIFFRESNYNISIELSKVSAQSSHMCFCVNSRSTALEAKLPALAENWVTNKKGMFLASLRDGWAWWINCLFPLEMVLPTRTGSLGKMS